MVAAGPDLAHAGLEASEVADIYSDVEPIDSDGATVERLRTVLERATTGHIACHARFEVDNPMFSSLRLADGDLNVYDLERMSRVPDVVVLSACDSGFSEAHPGEELMGLSSALLSLGAKSLVASVGLVPDSEATRELMVGLHRGLISGLGPAEALKPSPRGDQGHQSGVRRGGVVCLHRSRLKKHSNLMYHGLRSAL